MVHTHPHSSARPHRHPVLMVQADSVANERGLWAVKWSFIGLMITAVGQLVVVLLSGSVALLADTIHNFGDAVTAVPLAVAFVLARRKPSSRFTYGLGRVEDIAGLLVVLLILVSALVVGYQSLDRLLHPRPMTHLWVVGIAAVLGFAGNEAVALFRIRVGRKINSAALVADGYHARTDGLSSLSVLIGAIGVGLGFPWADPVVGLLISLLILWITWGTARAIFTRMLDGVDEHELEEIRDAARHVPGVAHVADARVRWTGHRLRAELWVVPRGEVSLEDACTLANEVRHAAAHRVGCLANATVRVVPAAREQELKTRELRHAHDGLAEHVHVWA